MNALGMPSSHRKFYYAQKHLCLEESQGFHLIFCQLAYYSPIYSFQTLAAEIGGKKGEPQPYVANLQVGLLEFFVQCAE